MGRTFTKPDEGDFQLAPEGTSAAVLTVLAYVGKHESTWQGQTRIRELVGLAWELAERGDDGRGLAVTEVITASLNPKAKFYSRVLALSGGREPPEGADLEKLLGRGAIVSIVHEERDGRTYANVSGVIALPRGTPAPAPTVPPVYYDVLTPDPEALERVPARFRKLLDAAPAGGPPPRPAPAPGPAQGQRPADDDIPW